MSAMDCPLDRRHIFSVVPKRSYQALHLYTLRSGVIFSLLLQVSRSSNAILSLFYVCFTFIFALLPFCSWLLYLFLLVLLSFNVRLPLSVKLGGRL